MRKPYKRGTLEERFTKENAKLEHKQKFIGRLVANLEKQGQKVQVLSQKIEMKNKLTPQVEAHG